MKPLYFITFQSHSAILVHEPIFHFHQSNAAYSITKPYFEPYLLHLTLTPTLTYTPPQVQHHSTAPHRDPTHHASQSRSPRAYLPTNLVQVHHFIQSTHFSQNTNRFASTSFTRNPRVPALAIYRGENLSRLRASLPRCFRACDVEHEIFRSLPGRSSGRGGLRSNSIRFASLRIHPVVESRCSSVIRRQGGRGTMKTRGDLRVCFAG
jgi:hypothetical protein